MMPRGHSVFARWTVADATRWAFLSVLGATLAVPLPATAAAKVWNNASGGNWSTAANWTGGLPGPGDDVDVTLTGTYTVTLDVITPGLNSVVLGGASGTQTLAIPAGNVLRVGNPSPLASPVQSTINANGVISLSGGDIVMSGPPDPIIFELLPAFLKNLGTITAEVGTSSTMSFSEFSTFSNAGGAKIDVQGTLDIGGLSLHLENAGTINIASGAPIRFGFSGTRATLANTGTFLLNGGAMVLHGSIYDQSAGITDLGAPFGRIFPDLSNFVFFSGGILKGNGGFGGGDPKVFSGTALIAPGASPGFMSSGNIDLQSGATLAVELNGTAPGVTYDQVQTFAPTLAGFLVTSVGFAPAVGTVFVILDNFSSDAISGTFAGLAEGATYVVGATRLQISYSGGTGNDVTLTVVSGAAGPSSTTLTATPNPSFLGQSVTLTASVTGASPTGTVQFVDGAANLGAPVALIGGVATLTTSTLSVDSHLITAVYGGDAGNLASASPTLTLTVNAAPVSPNPIPTLDASVLALMALLLGLGGGFAMRHRNRSHG